MVLRDCSRKTDTPDSSPLSVFMDYSTFNSSLHFAEASLSFFFFFFEQCSRSTTEWLCTKKVVRPLIWPLLFVMPCIGASCLNINQHACQGMSSFCFVDLRKAETHCSKVVSAPSRAVWSEHAPSLDPLLCICEP